MARCLIGCGSNRGSRRELLDRAIELLRFMPGITVLAVSRYRETAAVGGPAGQPPFLNGACLIDTDLGPHDVLDTLAAIEKTLHRERTERWGPRTIDLDLLLYGDDVIESSRLTVPHPRLGTRRFVLEPAAEIAGELVVPGAGCSIRDLLDTISTAHPLVAVVGVPGSGAPEVASAVADAVLGVVTHAPAPLPGVEGGPAVSLSRWHQTLVAWAAPLESHRGGDSASLTIADYLLDSLLAAAEDDLDADEFDALRHAAAAVASRCAPVNVVIALVTDRPTLEERLAFRAHSSRDHTNVFADLAPAALVCDDVGDRVSALLRMQDRLLRHVRSAMPPGRRPPRAAIVIDASDLAQAAAEATAAVEAML
ncbi:MAG: 2-amino-4-hydroxy-6-hydroxymethyldihydropteridine diphosphokinase [Planctomycetaceae bacterium]